MSLFTLFERDLKCECNYLVHNEVAKEGKAWRSSEMVKSRGLHIRVRQSLRTLC